MGCQQFCSVQGGSAVCFCEQIFSTASQSLCWTPGLLEHGC